VNCIGLGLNSRTLRWPGLLQGIREASLSPFQRFQVGQSQLVQHLRQISRDVGLSLQVILESPNHQQQRIGPLKDVPMTSR